MKPGPRQSSLLGIASGLCAIALPSAATADTRTYLDLTGSAGYSRNPFLEDNGGGSVFGRVSAFGSHSIRSERGTTDLSAFVENSTYLGDQGSKQIFDLNAGTRYQISELVQLFGEAEFSGDFGGQLIGRFEDVPGDPAPVPGDVPPPPDDLFDPDALNLDRRTYRVGAEIGADLTISERDTVTVAGSGRHIFFGSNSDEDNYTVATATLGWQRQLSERTGAGANLSVERANYSGDHHSTIVNPQLTLRTTLGEGWDADFGVGLSYVRRHTESGNDTSVTPSFNASVCRATEAERYCGRASYSTGATTTQDARTTTRVGVDYSNRLNAKDTFQANVNLIRYAGDNVGTNESKTSYYGAAMSFSRKFSDRLSAGANVGARKFVEKGEGDVPMDLSASAFVRYRLGDLL